MPQRKRKISDLTAGDANSLLQALNQFQHSLDDEDEDLPSGLLSALGEFRAQLEAIKHVSFSKVDAITLLQVGIKTGPLFLVPETSLLAEGLGSTEVDGKSLTMEVLKQMISLVRHHVSVVTEAGCRVLINLILLRVASTMSTNHMDVNIIPEFPIAKTVFPGNRSFGGVVDFLLTKLPEKYTEFLLADPTGILANTDEIKGTLTSNIFEAKRNNVRAALPQAVIAAASHCKQHNLPVMRGCITSGEQWVFFVYEKRNDDRGHVSSSNEFVIGPQFEGLALILGLLHDWANNTTSAQQVFFTTE